MGSGLLSPTHLAVVLAVVLIVFGPKRLPELGKALGNGMRSFKHALDGGDDEESVPLAPPAAETPPAPVTPVEPTAHAEDPVAASPPGDQSPAA
jgi:sec-independent protein translocase protein TatA